ncbi:MAG: cytochrome c-type biogenesis protein CcmH [Chloroflexi bacterium]|nr:cytochrome c-type biogenesis protein CcmH [Chloroflexota bacterium]
MSRIPWKLKLLLVASFLPLFVSACSASPQAQSIDEKARDIYRSLMCPICSGQTLEESQSALSAQMRVTVREMLEQGKTKEEILQFFVERYGEGVLAAPPKSRAYLLLWLAPLIALGIGGFLVARVIRSGLSRKERVAEAPALDTQYWQERLQTDLKDWEAGKPKTIGRPAKRKVR